MRRPVNRQPILKAQDLYLLLVLLAKPCSAHQFVPHLTRSPIKVPVC